MELPHKFKMQSLWYVLFAVQCPWAVIKYIWLSDFSSRSQHTRLVSISIIYLACLQEINLLACLYVSFINSVAGKFCWMQRFFSKCSWTGKIRIQNFGHTINWRLFPVQRLQIPNYDPLRSSKIFLFKCKINCNLLFSI